jgi:hypothetical protein
MRTVSTLEQARAALSEGERELISPPFAACHAGVGYYAALCNALHAECPAQGFTFTLCCGADAAIGDDALRSGFSHVLCDCEDEQFEQLSRVASTLKASVLRPISR